MDLLAMAVTKTADCVQVLVNVFQHNQATICSKTPKTLSPAWWVSARLVVRLVRMKIIALDVLPIGD
jgi:hypothetical protein